MTFFLGQDVSITALTESTAGGVTVAANGTESFPTTATAGFAAKRGGTATEWDQITSCDLSIGAMDEDISYFGIRQQTKAEIKKETTVTFTRKKTNAEWDTLFNDVRYGVKASSAAAEEGLEEPTITHGYRVFITINSGNGDDEVITLMGCCIQGHTVTVNTDGTMDETLELMTYITPVYQTAAYTTAIGTAQL
tara:strand:+ start:320 stop:901 length:582 start_codon:yes stop_codon:yes gene_type:complete